MLTTDMYPSHSARKHEHRHPGRAELRDADAPAPPRRDAGGAQRDEPPVGVADVAEQRGPQHPSGACRRPRPLEQFRRGQQPVLAEERAELVQRREERDEIERGDAPLQHLPSELEVDRREPVHDVTSGTGPSARRADPAVSRSACRAAYQPGHAGDAGSRRGRRRREVHAAQRRAPRRRSRRPGGGWPGRT